MPVNLLSFFLKMTKRPAEMLMSSTFKMASSKIHSAPEFEDIELSKLPLSTHPVPLISVQKNIELETLYLSSQRKFKPKKFTKATETRAPNLNNNSTRKPKKQVALLLSYCGEGYQGMQVNPTVPTIELDLFKALALSGAVSEQNAMDPSKFNFMRCARTDKGVHAAGQVVSLKMILEENVIDRINQYLPPQIRVWGYSRVNNSFHAKNNCDSRVYEYLLPTYVLNHVDPELYPLSAVGVENGVKPRQLEFVERELEKPDRLGYNILLVLDLKRAYRIDSATLQYFRALLKKYQGPHLNFHNFTIGKSFKDKSSFRNIKSFTVGDPFVRKGLEWVSCKVHGQSFMLHQIRKMIGMCIMMVRTKTPADMLSKCFGETRLNIPKAPALGLLLEKV